MLLWAPPLVHLLVLPEVTSQSRSSGSFKRAVSMGLGRQTSWFPVLNRPLNCCDSGQVTESLRPPRPRFLRWMNEACPWRVARDARGVAICKPGTAPATGHALSQCFRPHREAPLVARDAEMRTTQPLHHRACSLGREARRTRGIGNAVKPREMWTEEQAVLPGEGASLGSSQSSWSLRAARVARGRIGGPPFDVSSTFRGRGC